MKKRDLVARLNVLEEESRRRGDKKVRFSKWNITLNPNTYIDNAMNYTEKYIQDALRDIIILLADNLEEVIRFNDPDHEWYQPYIISAKVRYALEQGEGRQRKDGTYPATGGFIHAHVRIEITHRSNISLIYGALRKLLQPEFERSFGKQGYIGTPKLVSEDQTERYITKSKYYKKGYKWVTLVR